MKNKLYIIVLLLFAPVLIFKFYYPSTENQKTAAPLPYTDKFLIGVMHSYFAEFLDHYDDAGFNTTHRYIYGKWDSVLQRHTPTTDITGTEEDLFDPVPTQSIRNLISEMYSSHNGSRFIWQRPKIEWLCYGQSSIYEAEPISLDDDYWFYSFASVSGTPVADHTWNNGDTVLHCSNIESGPQAGYVLKRLKANTEQSRRSAVGGINQWSEDSECEWFIKPKIRIPAAYVVPANYETPVCKITVLMQDGSTIKKETIIKAKYFLDGQGQYNGEYREEYNFFGETDLNFTGDLVLDSAAPSWFTSARGNYNPDPENINRADIQVYWYDNCEMWIDYVKIENDIADGLMNPNNPLFATYNDWITDEANAINQEPYVYNFYTELFEFNNIPCMAYVNKKIDSITGGRVNFMADQLPFFFCHLSWSEKASILAPEKVKRLFFDVTKFKQIYVGDPYPLTANFPAGCYGFSNPQISVLPSSLNISSWDTILAVTRSPENYDRWLQSRFDTVCQLYEGGNIDLNTNKPYPAEGVFMYMLKWSSAIAKLCNIPLIVMLQAHQFVSSFEVDREPTIEEQDIMTNLAVSYGAKGITYWWMPSYFNNMCDYSFGFIRNGEPRGRNLYGQPKWDSMKSTIDRLEKWGPTLMSFHNQQTNSYIYRLERSNLISQTYFSDVVSYVRGSGLPPCQFDSPDTTDAPHPPDLRYECFEDRYLQVATFKSTSDDNRYFMVVNRRCSPLDTVNNDDGERYIRVLFDHGSADLPAFNNWNIIDVETGSTISVIKINGVNPYADLGWFNPGEGRLYKMVSTMKSGGILLGDEYVSAVNITCEDTVISNGYNITIVEGSVISFTDSRFSQVLSGGVLRTD